TESNLPSSESPDEKGEERSSSEMVTNYDYSRTQERKVQGAGGLARISVSVVINKDRLDEILGQAPDASEADPDDPAALVDAPDLETLKKQIQDSVQVAVGYDQARGDQVQVEFIAFSDVPEFSTLDEEESSEGPNWLLWGAIGALALLAIFVLRPVLQRRAAQRGGRVPLIAPDGSVIEPEDDEEAVGAELARRLRGLVDQFETVSADDLNKLVEFQEEASAQVLRRWIRSE
ncbi:MAG: flagellar M-ring protein FliF C-terminal domain-containing protein, partial [Myxococcota bacterium]|nr:flagellar M-ring protein FliF C-terminal domain-containing protein [Myxococcota bacterium]